MANLKISPNLYLGSLELNRLKRFLVDDGYKAIFKLVVNSFGVRITSDSQNSLQVYNGFAEDKVSIRAGLAVDRNVNCLQISADLADYLTIPRDAVKYTVYLKHKFSHFEQGTVDLGVDGQMVGVNTQFKKVLRGMSVNPVKIHFPESVLNTDEYEVLGVNSDTTAMLNTNIFQSESGLKYVVVGCFSPGIIIAENQKNIYEYDDYELGFKLSVMIEPTDVVLADVVNTSGQVQIIDRRNENKLSTI